MIINIRGTSGSGKTSLMRHFMENCSSVTPIQPNGSKKIKGYECIYKGQKIFVVGSYSNACGGCDTISTQDEIHSLIDDFAFDGHVIFEGLFISHIYGRYAERAKSDPENVVFFMLDTPFDTCMEHIRKRREEAGNTEDLKDSVYRNARKTFDSTYRIRDKLTKDGLQWENITMDKRVEQFDSLLDFYLDC